MSSSFSQRFGFKRSATSDVTQLGDISSSSNGVGFSDGNKIIEADIRKLSEVEANRRLSTFRAEHTFDPNLPESAFDAIDEATGEHDAKGEAELVGELVENSPYPEVGCAALRCAKVYTAHCTDMNRSVPLFETTTKMSLPALFERGPSV